jgi:hypothetical protein
MGNLCGCMLADSACGLGCGELIGGVVAGLIGSAIAWTVGRTVRSKRNRDDFGSLAGEYQVREKQPSEQPDGTVTISGSGPNLDFLWTLGNGSEARGRLAMNEQSRVTGSGSYEHRRGANRGWGDLTIQVASRERNSVRLLVDGRYTSQKDRQQVASAWVWETLRPR